MATDKITRTNDTAATLINVATISFTEDAETRHAQQCAIVDATTPTQKLAVSAGGAASVIGAANSGVDIGDTTINNAAGAAAVNVQDGGNAITVDWAGTAPPIGAGLEATALRVTVATDSTGVLSVDDNAGSLTVDNAALSVVGGGAEATALRVTLASDSTGVVSVDDNAGTLTVDNAGTFAVQIAANSAVNVAQVGGTNTVTGGTAGALAIGGIQAHDAADSGNQPVKIGVKAIAHGANPTAVSASGDITDVYANRAGVLFTIGGHPNIVTLELAATAAQTDVAVVTVAAGTKIVVTQIQATCDEANTVGVGFRVGFGAVNTPTTTGVVLTHPGMVAGQILSRGDGAGILGIGADGEDLRVTSEVPSGGSFRILVSYFSIES